MTTKEIEKRLLGHGEMINKSINWWEHQVAATLQKIEVSEKKLIINPAEQRKLDFLAAQLKYLILKGQFEQKNMAAFQAAVSHFTADSMVKQIIKNAIKEQKNKTKKRK